MCRNILLSNNNNNNKNIKIGKWKGGKAKDLSPPLVFDKL